MSVHSWFVTAPRGAVGALAQELRALGAGKVREDTAGCRVRGPLHFGYRICLWSRVANRVLLHLASFPAPGPDALYEAVAALPWEEHMGPDGTLAVDFVGQTDTIRHAHFGAQRVKDGIVDRFREREGRRPSVDAEDPDVRINVHVRGRGASVALDLSGGSLHRRGYRRRAVPAPLKENVAAAMLLGAGYDGAVPLVDPMCGSGTLAIEAALIATDRAPGLLRGRFGFERWLGHDAEAWTRLVDEANERATAGGERRPEIVASDIDHAAVDAAKRNAEAAGVAEILRFGHRPFKEMTPPTGPGIIVTNPPHGERMGDPRELPELYAEFGRWLRRACPGWRVVVLATDPWLVRRIGLIETTTTPVDNGPIRAEIVEATVAAAEHKAEPPTNDFANRLRKNWRARKKWARREDVDCFRVYDRDIVEYNVAVDVYDDWAHVQEYEARDNIDRGLAAQRLEQVVEATATVLSIPDGRVVVKRRRRQKDRSQYERIAHSGSDLEVHEGAFRFLVNLTDRLDTGLFLDHRGTRRLVQQLAAGRRFLNLFAYTGAATVYAVAAGAKSTTTVDLSRNYLDWARRNLELNDLADGPHRFECADVVRWVAESRETYDLIFLDPPSYSRSKRMEGDFDVVRDHPALVRAAHGLLAPGGVLLFSIHARGFELDPSLNDLGPTEVTEKTVPADFTRRPPPHRCWRFDRE